GSASFAWRTASNRPSAARTAPAFSPRRFSTLGGSRAGRKMTASRMLLPQHALLHAGDAGSGPSVADRTLTGLTDAPMRLRPGKGLNSIAWLLWHMARTEDVSVNLVVTNGVQVWDDEWARRMNVARKDIGTGMTEDEVSDLSEALDLSAARAYRTTVGRRTREVVMSLGDSLLEDTVTALDVARPRAAGAVGPPPRWR